MMGGGVQAEGSRKDDPFSALKRSKPYFFLLPKSFINTELFPYDCFSSQRDTSVQHRN